jgi:lipopolysaccharide transport system ATP-binding protein
MSTPSIRVENLGKIYRLGERDNYKTLRDSIAKSFKKVHSRTPDQYIWALRGVSFEVQEGEVVGIIGGNGAGKSTLLKLLSRITAPTEGRMELRGRVGSLLDVGIGFHPELTGRENIFLSGAILGMKKREIDERFEKIVEFSELRKFLDTPLKFYSSGMGVRLGFSVAAHMEPDILLIDEVLAAGDAAFQRKCLGKIQEVTAEGRTVLIVSHNLRAITDLCEKCFWIDHGRIVMQGVPQQVVVAYLGASQPQRSNGTIEPEMHDHATGEIFFRHVAIVNGNGELVSTFFFGEALRIRIDFEVYMQVSDVRIAVAIEKRSDGTLVGVLHNTDQTGSIPLQFRPGKYTALIDTTLPLLPGGYSIHLAAKPAHGYWGTGANLDLVRRAIDFNIEEFTRNGEAVPRVGGVIRPDSKWDIVEKGPLSVKAVESRLPS